MSLSNFRLTAMALVCLLSAHAFAATIDSTESVDTEPFGADYDNSGLSLPPADNRQNGPGQSSSTKKTVDRPAPPTREPSPTGNADRPRPVAIPPSRAMQPSDFSETRLDPATGTVRYLRSENLSHLLEKQPEYRKLQAENRYGEMALAFLNSIADTLKLAEPTTELRLKAVTHDDLGTTHVQLEQIYRDIPVAGSELRVHLDRDRHITYLQGSYIPTPAAMNLTPRLDKGAARAIAGKLATAEDCNSCQADLVIAPGAGSGAPRLAYRIAVSKNLGQKWTLLIDADNGDVLDQTSTVFTR